MATNNINNVLIRASNTSGVTPSSLAQGTDDTESTAGAATEIAINRADGKLFYLNDSDAVTEFTVSATVSGNTFATDLKIGRDAHNNIDFSTDDQITFNVANAAQLVLTNNLLAPSADDDLDLGSSSQAFQDLYLEGNLNFTDDSNMSNVSNIVGHSGSHVTIDSENDIILDANGGDVSLKDDGTQFAALKNSSTNLQIESGSTTAATFSGANVTFAGSVSVTGAANLNGSAHLGDNDYMYFGADNDYSLGYVSGNYLAFAQSVNSSPFGIIFKADSGGDDAGDEWRMDLADGGVMSWGNDINSAHTYVTHFSCTPNSTVANSTFAMAGHATVGHDLTVSGDLAVTGSYGLAASDIPNLAASKITSGTFATARIADDAITTAKINDGDVTNAKLAGSIDDSKLSTITTTNKVHVASLDIDGATDIGEALADADLFIVDNGANSTERKSTMSRIKTYVLSDSTVTPASGDSFLTLDSDGSTTQRTTVDALATLLAGTNISASSGVLSATNTTYSVGDGGLTTNDFTNADHSKLNGIEASADVTDTSNVTSAGALMDSEVTNLSFVKGLTKGISDGNVLTANDAVADNDFLRIDGTEVEGLTAAEVRSALNVADGATANTGDITGVTAGNGLTGGGSSGAVTVNVVGGTGITANSNDIALTNGLIADGSNITSVGTLGSLQVDNVGIDGNTMSISGGGHDFTIDGAGNISVDATDNIIFKKAGTTAITFDIDTSPEIDFVGNTKLDATGTFEVEGTTVKLDASGDIELSADGGNVTMDDGQGVTVVDFDVDNVAFKLMDDADTGDYFSIATGAAGATTISTVDDGGAAAHLTVAPDGNLAVNLASGAEFTLQENSGTYTPSADTHVATKKYVDDNLHSQLSAGNGIALSSTTLSVAGNTGLTANSDGLSLQHLGIENLSDPNADRLLMWDDSAGAIVFCSAGDNLSFDGTDLDAAGGGGGSTNAAGSDTQIQFNDGGTNFGGSANLIWDDTALKIASTSSGTALLELKSTAATSSSGHGPFLDIRRDVTPSDNHELGRVRFLGDTSTGSNKVYGAIMCETVDVTNGSIEGVLTFESAISNSNTEIFKAGAADTSGTEAVFPATNNAIDLGTSSLGWKDLYVSGDIYAGGTAGVTTTASGGTDHVDAVIGVEIIPGEFGGPDQVNLTTVQLQFTKGVLTRIQA